MSEMIERVAKAISPNWGTMSSNDRRNARITAQVMLTTIREPTEAMIYAGGHAAPPDGPYADGPGWIRNRWHAMIDEALQ